MGGETGVVSERSPTAERVPPTYPPAGAAGAALHLGLLLGYLGQYARGRLEYRGDLLAGLLAEVLQQGVTLTFLAVIFASVPTLAGWSRPEVYFVYAVYQLSFALGDMLSGSVWSLGERYIVRGELDRILLRPVSPLLQLLLEGVAAEQFTQLAAGLVILLWAWRAAGLRLAWWMPPLLLSGVAAGAVIFLAVFLALACLAFFVDGRTGIMPLVYNLTAYAQYPTTIYGRALRLLFTLVLPFGFAAFYPAAALLRPSAYLAWGLAAPAVAALACALAVLIWRQGLRRYQGTGS